jgi:hypothetical protein
VDVADLEPAFMNTTVDDASPDSTCGALDELGLLVRVRIAIEEVVMIHRA